MEQNVSPSLNFKSRNNHGRKQIRLAQPTITRNMWRKQTRLAQPSVTRHTRSSMVSRWSSHSIRVTACNLLHRQGLPDSYIQQRLRWKSLAWRDYIRNTIYSAAQHKAALKLTSRNIPVIIDSTTGKPLAMTRSQPEELDRIAGVGLAACAA